MHTIPDLDFNQVPHELILIVELIRNRKGEAKKEIDENKLISVDWDKFLELAIHHRLYPSLYVLLSEMKSKLIPDYVIQSLYPSYKKNIFHMIRLTAEMEQVSQSFTENGIRMLNLKGPALAHDLYGDISLRTSGDLDMLIHLEDINKADAILLKLGYIKEELPTVLNDWKWRHHHLTYFHPVKNTTLEMHWRLNPGPAKEPRFEELWLRKRKSGLVSSFIYILGREDLFLFLASHGARHGWSRLRWLEDMDRLIEQGLNWSWLFKQFKRYQFLHIGGQSLILASKLLDTPLPREVEPFIMGNLPARLAQQSIFYLQQMVNLHTPPLPEHVSNYHKRYNISLMSRRKKFLFYLSYLYPYPEDATSFPLPKRFHALYFPLRPLIWVWRKSFYYRFDT